MKRVTIFILVMCSMPVLLLSQTVSKDCSKIKTGTFYSYPGGSEDQILVRDTAVQQVISNAGKDTTFWKIAWLDSCSFTMKYIRTTHPVADKEAIFMKAMTIVMKIQAITDKYYLFTGGLDPATQLHPAMDTAWFRAR